MWSGSREELLALADSHPSHPYNKVGLERLERYASEACEIFRSAGIKFSGEVGCNHYRLTPIGALKPAWLTMDEYVTFRDVSDLGQRGVVIVTFDGYLDFYPEFIATGLRGRGAECRVVSVSLPELERLRESATEMRAVNIARVMRGDTLARLAKSIREVSSEEELVLLPAVFGLGDVGCFDKLTELAGRQLKLAPTVSVSVPGIRAQRLLTEEFVRLGGEMIQGDRVVDFLMRDGRIESLSTEKHSDILFVAEDYILASGSFFGRGLIATSEAVCEPLFGLDVEAAESREEWCAERILAEQPFQRFGVKTDERLRPSINGRRVENLYAVGSVLCGADSVKEGCGAGVVVSTALMAAENILQVATGSRREEE
jgi:glycerol-3-phosphate dehydrogenase subunit B